MWDKGWRNILILSRSVFFSFSHLPTLPLVMFILPLALATFVASTHAQITGTLPATPLASITGLVYPSGIVSNLFSSCDTHQQLFSCSPRKWILIRTSLVVLNLATTVAILPPRALILFARL